MFLDFNFEGFHNWEERWDPTLKIEGTTPPAICGKFPRPKPYSPSLTFQNPFLYLILFEFKIFDLRLSGTAFSLLMRWKLLKLAVFWIINSDFTIFLFVLLSVGFWSFPVSEMRRYLRRNSTDRFPCHTNVSYDGRYGSRLISKIEMLLTKFDLDKKLCRKLRCDCRFNFLKPLKYLLNQNQHIGLNHSKSRWLREWVEILKLTLLISTILCE
jgi:hypothetical protein